MKRIDGTENGRLPETESLRSRCLRGPYATAHWIIVAAALACLPAIMWCMVVSVARMYRCFRKLEAL